MKSLFYFILLLFVIFYDFYQKAIAQIIPDQTLNNENSVITTTSTGDLITGGAIRGNNLFHSFQEFNITEGQEVDFNNPNNITRIITRVTGSNISQILGKLGVNGNADLFLLNPNGFIFGNNAQLNLTGSFIASSSDRILFNDGSFYSATQPEIPSLLSINVPIGLQMGNNPGNITILGSPNQIFYSDNYRPIFRDRPLGLQVSSNSTFALIGGNITFNSGNITAAGGRLELGSISGNNTIELLPVANGWTFDYSKVQQFQDIKLINASSLDASGNRGGDIQIQGKSLLIADGSAIVANNLGNISSGGINIKTTDSVILTGNNNLDFPSTILTEADLDATANGGFLNINTGDLLLDNGAVISSATFGAGNGGELTINASKSVKLKGFRGQGVASFILSESNETATGNGSTMIITTPQLIIQDGGIISASTTNTGDGGSIIVNAADFVEISGKTPLSNAKSGITVAGGKEEQGIVDNLGQAGNLVITTNSLIIRDEAFLNGQNQGLDDGGTLDIRANSIFLDNKALLTANTVSGQGGNILLKVKDLLQMRHESDITTNSQGRGNGGNIIIDTDLLVALEDSDITANAVIGEGGRVIVKAQGIFGTEFRDNLTPKSDITATSQLGSQFNGIVTINTTDIEPNLGLLDLPDQFTDPSSKIVQGCPSNSGNRFIITGKGGLPENPYNLILGEQWWQSNHYLDNNYHQDLPKSQLQNNSVSYSNFQQPISAQAWFLNSQGQIVLTANTVTNNQSHLILPNCK